MHPSAPVQRLPAALLVAGLVLSAFGAPVALATERGDEIPHTVQPGDTLEGLAQSYLAAPQLWPRLAGPLVAVLAYSLTVVDMALVIGPQGPPTLAVLAWQWLLDADAAVNAQGAAAAWLLAGVVAVLAGTLWALRHAAHWRARWTAGSRGRIGTRHTVPGAPLVALAALYGGVMLALALGSLAGAWPFPQLWPRQWGLQAWQSVAAGCGTGAS